MDLEVRVGHGRLGDELADVVDEDRVVFEAHRNVVLVELVQAEEDLLRHVHVDRHIGLPSDLDLGLDERHELLTKEVHAFLVRQLREDIAIRLIPQVDLNGLIELGDLLLSRRIDHNLLRKFGELFLRRRLGRRLCGSRGSGSGSSRIRLRKADIVRLDVAETVQDEVHALRVLGEQLLHDRVDAHVDTVLLVLLVSGSNDRAQVEVDRGRVVLLHELLDVQANNFLCDGQGRLVDPARIVPNARECLDELTVDALCLRLEIAQVQVARASDQFLHLNEALGEQLVAIVLRLVVRTRGEREAERLRIHLLDSGENLREAVEDHNLRLGQTMGTRVVKIHVRGVVEGPDMVEHRALSHLEMDLWVLENELVAVVAVQQLSQRGLGEGR